MSRDERPRRGLRIARSASYAPLRRPVPPDLQPTPPQLWAIQRRRTMREEGSRGSGLWSRLVGAPEPPDLPPGAAGPCALLASRYRGSLAPAAYAIPTSRYGSQQHQQELSQRSSGRLAAHRAKEDSPAPGLLPDEGMWGGGVRSGDFGQAGPLPAKQFLYIPDLPGSPPRRRDLGEPSPPIHAQPGGVQSSQRRSSLIAALSDSVELGPPVFAQPEPQSFDHFRRNSSPSFGLPAYADDRLSTPLDFERGRPLTASMYQRQRKTVRFAAAAGNPLSPTAALNPERMATLRLKAVGRRPGVPPPQAWAPPRPPNPPPYSPPEQLSNIKRSLTVGSLVDPHAGAPNGKSVVRGDQRPQLPHPPQGALGGRNSRWRSSMNTPIYSIRQVLQSVGESYYSTGGDGGGPLAECRNPVLAAPRNLQDSQALDPLDLPARLMRGRPADRGSGGGDAMRRSRSQPMHQHLATTPAQPSNGSERSDMDSGWQSGGSSSGKAEEEGRLSFYSTTSATTSDSNSSADHRDVMFVVFSDTSVGSGGGEGVLAEAIWDHVTLAADELSLRAGDVLTVLDWSHPEAWFGTAPGDRSGWFPATHVRLLANQSGDSGQSSPGDRSSSLRTSVLQELLSTERDYVTLLRNVVDGFLRQAERRPEMFGPERLLVIFGNLEEIYALHRRFLADLEEACARPEPCVAHCFLKHERAFEIYSDYCNNQPLSSTELGALYGEAGFRHFFEACRLLRGLPSLALDAFLLTPVQRICKYPLQLAELAKHTPSAHPDAAPCQKALLAMKAVARVINERKRRLEHLQSIALWERGVEGWVGPSLLERNSHLVHSGELTLRFVAEGASAVGWTKDVHAFLFNNTLVLTKKDMLKRQQLIFRDQVPLEGAKWHFLSDGKDTTLGVSVKNGWRLEVPGRGSWLGTCRSREARRGWETAVRELPAAAVPPPTAHDRRIARAAVKAAAADTRPPARVSKKSSSSDLPNSKSVPGKMWNRLKAA